MEGRVNDRVEVWVARQLRHYLTRRLSQRSGKRCTIASESHVVGDLAGMTLVLRRWFVEDCERERDRTQRLTERYGWEALPSAAESCREPWREADGDALEIAA